MLGKKAKNITVLRDLMLLEPELDLVILVFNKEVVLNELRTKPIARLAKQLNVPYGKFSAMVELMKQMSDVGARL